MDFSIVAKSYSNAST